MAKRVVGRTHRRGQGNEPFGIELAQQRPRGHVLGLSVRRDPIPPLAKRLGQLGAMPTRMRRDQRTHEPDVIVAERAPLDDSVRLPWGATVLDAALRVQTPEPFLQFMPQVIEKLLARFLSL